MLAMFWEITSTLVSWAAMPVAAIRSALMICLPAYELSLPSPSTALADRSWVPMMMFCTRS